MTSITALTRSPAWALVTPFAKYDRVRREIDTGARLGRAEQRLMWLVMQDRTLTLRDVAEHLGLEQSTVNRQVNAAIKAGLLHRYRESRGSAYSLAATDQGAELFREDLTWQLGLLDSALQDLPAAEREAFPDTFARFIEAYENALSQSAGSGSPRPS
ncbi:MAG: MarR family winged helix-turn-helix transcriptional regulator [Aeromicrobium sp.]|uniref:MarR family winged helix-turn-helix transcriptional regulator n=1 Tax=Aeromicrobium sp. TaxID=1871063 RepID=UPI0039E45FD9